MKASADFEPQLARMLREQARSQRLSAFDARRAVTLCGGPGVTERWRQSACGSQRTLPTNVHQAASPCSCRAPDCAECGTALTRRRREAQECGCIAGGAVSRGAGARMAVSRPAASTGPTLSPAPGGPIVMGPRSIYFPSFPEIVPPTAPEETAFSGDYFDIHAHNFCSTFSDWEHRRNDTVERIERLVEPFQREGVGRMVISGMIDVFAGTDFIDDPATLNEITAFAANLYPDYFVAFAQLSAFELADPRTSKYVADLLEDGFEGVGELFVHGHWMDINDNEPLFQICRVAAYRGAPVQVHWDIGNVESDEGGSASDAFTNFEQLLALLDRFPKAPVEGYTLYSETDVAPLKLILAHCGAGPGTLSAEALAAFKPRLEQLLVNYPNVYFDLAGMQTVEGAEQKLFTETPPPREMTDLGKFVFDLIPIWSTRFLFGTDAENRFDRDRGLEHLGSTTYAASVGNYATFLDMRLADRSPIEDHVKERVKHLNAFHVLYSKPTIWGAPRFSESIPSFGSSFEL